VLRILLTRCVRFFCLSAYSTNIPTEQNSLSGNSEEICFTFLSELLIYLRTFRSSKIDQNIDVKYHLTVLCTALLRSFDFEFIARSSTTPMYSDFHATT